LAGTLLLGLAVGGCGRIGEPIQQGGAQVVNLRVVQGPGGGTLAFLPVTINGKGPFAFALDTGASHSVVDSSIADQLNLKSDGATVEMSGVAAELPGTPVEVDDWSVEGVKLPGKTVVAAKLSSRISQGGMEGLLGSDVLSTFDEITIDYVNQQLILR